MATNVQVSEAAVLWLGSPITNVQVSEAAVLVLWGTVSNVQVSELGLLYLARKRGRRIVGHIS